MWSYQRGALLALIARRENTLQEVADQAREYGSPDVLIISAEASSAAIVSFFETLRVEVGPEIKITIVTPRFIESEMTQGKFLLKEGKMEVDQDLRDVGYWLISYSSH
uniref:Uncharacterized protein n=1 Tax=Quercus lobata TaxID=97700 RepID=A0A7N2MPT7_QUELO